MYTLDDYKAAKQELEALNKSWENYSGNNPNKYQASIRSASAKVRSIESALKAAGLLERSPTEVLHLQLDRAFPNARSKEIVEFNGKKYVRKFMPLRKSLSGKTVKEWEKSWEEVRLETAG